MNLTDLEVFAVRAASLAADLSDFLYPELRQLSDRISENGHEFVIGASLGFDRASILHAARVCLHCGIMRHADGQNKACRGTVHIALRDGNQRTIDGDLTAKGK
ncbi:hypothetical protein [Burkholderia sp. Ax-1719]|uniref:hypothetical protein n=1 Tax=Burkholderia sp. Ax-1719 TaxID=2608334 RepID=UPI00142124DE|nr:hypothetical protein [Burkholderia sp. Ax-1719]NIE67434.1 hypothetical protein [Burkholderia sp. Ax-1719]